MLDRQLQLMLIIATVLFSVTIINMIRNKKLELKYSLIWLGASLGLLLISIVPGAIGIISNIIHIETPVNTLYLFIIFLLILIIFSLTMAASRNYSRVRTLIQEVGILKLELKKLTQEDK